MESFYQREIKIKSDYSQTEIKLFETLGFDFFLIWNLLLLIGFPLSKLSKRIYRASSSEWDEMIHFDETQIREMSEIIDSVKFDRDGYACPSSYQPDDWYLKCDNKKEVLNDVLGLLG